LAGRYLAPFLPAPALAAALLAGRIRSPLATALSLVLAVWVLWSTREWLQPRSTRALPTYPAWTVAEFEPIAEELRARELTWTELLARLQGPNVIALIGYLSSVVEPGEMGPPAPDEGLLVLALTPADADAVMAQLPGDDVQRFSLAEFDALLVRTPARADRLGSRICRTADDCTEVVVAVTNRVYQSQFSAWVGRGPAMQWLTADGHPQPERLLWKVPIRRGAEAVLVINTRPRDRCAWQFVASEGFAASSPLPATTVALPAAAEGELLVARPLVSDGCDEFTALPPMLTETAPGWTRLRELLQRSD
jgi:hypothetical protein